MSNPLGEEDETRGEFLRGEEDKRQGSSRKSNLQPEEIHKNNDNEEER